MTPHGKRRFGMPSGLGLQIWPLPQLAPTRRISLARYELVERHTTILAWGTISLKRE